MKTIILLAFCFFSVITNAQLGGLLNKAKDKVLEKKDKKKEQAEVKSETNVLPGISGNENSGIAATAKSNQGGTIIFGNEPFTTLSTGTKAKFTSSENIYGQLQLKSGTLKDFFKIKDKDPNKRIPYYFLNYIVFLSKNGKSIADNKGIWNSMYVADADVNNNYLNFDVLPSSAKVTTVINALDDFSAGSAGAPLVGWISPQYFKEEGNYDVTIQFTYPSYDEWGKIMPTEQWTMIEESITFNFSKKDIAKLTSDRVKVDEAAKAVIANSRPIPSAWKATSNKINCGISEASLKSLFIGGLSSWGSDVTILKLYADKGAGNYVQKDDYGFPVRKSYNQHYVAFCKKAGTGQCFYQNFYVFNEYAGGGTYHKSLSIGLYDAVYISCDKLK